MLLLLILIIPTTAEMGVEVCLCPDGRTLGSWDKNRPDHGCTQLSGLTLLSVTVPRPDISELYDDRFGLVCVHTFSALHMTALPLPAALSV